VRRCYRQVSLIVTLVFAMCAHKKDYCTQSGVTVHTNTPMTRKPT